MRKSHYADCHYAECHYAECHYAECHYAEWQYAECRYAVWWRRTVSHVLSHFNQKKLQM
jgi:hypothetical protein